MQVRVKLVERKAATWNMSKQSMAQLEANKSTVQLIRLSWDKRWFVTGTKCTYLIHVVYQVTKSIYRERKVLW